MRRLLRLLLVVAFIGIIITPAVANIMGSDGADPDAENRALAPFPTLSFHWTDIRAYLPGVDAWFSDHFGFRNDLVKAYGISRYFWLHVSPSASVGLGPRGWLFYLEDGGLEDFSNQNPLTEAQIQTWRSTVARAKKWSSAHGIAYAFMVAPDKSSIYPEFFPQTARRVNRLSRTDQIVTGISDLGIGIDVRPVLLEEKHHNRLYHKTDTHWNPRGAYLAYRTIVDALRLQVPAIPPPKPPDAFTPESRSTAGMDLAGMMGLKRVIGEEYLAFTPKQKRQYVVREPAGNIVEAGEGRIVTEIPGSTLPRAVVFRDSFMSAVAPYLSEHFSRVVYLWRNDFDVEEVQKEHPDVVLQEIVSRHVQIYMPTPELIPEP